MSRDKGHIHSVHHYNYVPYSYAASYNHPIEGLLNDILGSFVAAKVTGLSDREALVFFTVASIKAVDDHASMELPFNPIRIWGWFFGNGMVHHNIHHQMWGLKVSNRLPIFSVRLDYNLTRYQYDRATTVYILPSGIDGITHYIKEIDSWVQNRGRKR